MNKMEERLEKYAELYDGAVEQLPETEREKASQDRDASYADFDNWTRRARDKVRRHRQETSATSWPAWTQAKEKDTRRWRLCCRE